MRYDGSMSDIKPKVRTENLDGTEVIKPLDEVTGVSHNRQSSIGIRTLNLDTEEKQTMQTGSKKLLVGIIISVALIAGFGTGFGAFKLRMKATVSPEATQQVAGDKVQAGDVFGVKDDQTFKDSAEGYLEKGGTEEGEGSHKLLREGGASQTVYLTSSITDLDKLVGMKVKVWGETFKGQKAGWLMDVGRVQVVEVKAEPPVAE